MATQLQYRQVLMKMFSTTLAFLLLACGGKATVDLGGNSANAGWSDTKGSQVPGTSARAAMQTLYQGDYVAAMAVDETTIAAIIDGREGVHIDACQLADCKGTLQTIYVQPRDPLAVGGVNFLDLFVSDDEVIWQNVNGYDDYHLVACPSTGCESEPRTISNGSDALAMTASADSIFWLNRDHLARCPKVGCDTPTLSPLSDAVANLLFYGNPTSPPVLRESAGVLYVAGGTEIFRMPADFSAELTPIHSDPIGVTGLAVIGDYVYFARSILAGEIRRCPVTGCETSEVVTAAPGWPDNPVGDEKGIYWTHRAPESYGSSDAQYDNIISRFSLGGTSTGATDIATFEDLRQAWTRSPSPAVNSHHVYWCEADILSGRVTNSPYAEKAFPAIVRSTIRMVAR